MYISISVALTNKYEKCLLPPSPCDIDFLHFFFKIEEGSDVLLSLPLDLRIGILNHVLAFASSKLEMPFCKDLVRMRVQSVPNSRV